MSDQEAGFPLTIERVIEAPREVVYRCWTDAELLKQWFAPKPYETPFAELDVRTGGSALIVMRGPDGVDLPNPGVYLEVTPNERIVSTDAYVRAWEPSARPFMTMILTFAEADEGRTRYTARVLHWSEEDRSKHEAMGFYRGWSICTDQLAALARSIAAG